MSIYYQRDIYRFLAKHGPHRVIEITHKLGLPYRGGSKHPTRPCAQAVAKLKESGLVERDGTRWRVVSGTRAPKDGRGKSAGSLLALRSHSRHNVMKLHARMGRHIKPVATTALEQAWGWLPSTSRVAPDNESCCNLGSLPATISSAKPD